jgi:hypothetical protein
LEKLYPTKPTIKGRATSAVPSRNGLSQTTRNVKKVSVFDQKYKKADVFSKKSIA